MGGCSSLALSLMAQCQLDSTLPDLASLLKITRPLYTFCLASRSSKRKWLALLRPIGQQRQANE
jgi:hypothetical protein